MKAKGIVIFLVLMLLASFILANLISAEEQDKELVLAFFTGNKYLELEINEKYFYIQGLMDASWVILSYLKPETYQKYKESTENMPVLQLIKILDKYLAENPEELHLTVAVSFLNAIDEIVFKD